MCVVSMIIDHNLDKFPRIDQWPFPTYPNPNDPSTIRAELEQLRREFNDMKELLKKAKIYDEQTNQPDCEMETKVEKLKKIAELLGLNMDDVFVRK